jgi:hypothetical protein
MPKPYIACNTLGGLVRGDARKNMIGREEHAGDLHTYLAGAVPRDVKKAEAVCHLFLLA